MTSLAQSPMVSNVRRTGAKFDCHKLTRGQTRTSDSSRKLAAWEEHFQQHRLSYSPDVITKGSAEAFSPAGSPHSPQLAPNDSVSNRGSPAPSSQCSAPIAIDRGKSTPTSRYPAPSSQRSVPFVIDCGKSTPASGDPTLVSEPYWLAFSDLASIYTTQSAKVTSRSSLPTSETVIVSQEDIDFLQELFAEQ